MTEERQYIGIIADVVGSRNLSLSDRGALQKEVDNMLKSWNVEYKEHIASDFLITVGDEFQGLLNNSNPIINILWNLSRPTMKAKFRVGIGRGELRTEQRDEAIGMDGPVWYSARDAITRAKARKALGGVFDGFGDEEDQILNGIARLLEHMRSGFTRTQWETVNALREEPESETKAAEVLGLNTPQAFYSRKKSAGWDNYEEGERGLTEALKLFCSKERSP